MTDPAQTETSLAASVSPALAARLSRLGLTRNIDFLLHLPLRYEDETHLTPIAEARIGQTVQVEGEILHSEILHRKRRQLIAQLRDDTGTLHARWLNFYPSLPPRLVPGARFRFFGEIRAGFSGLEMVHPRLTAVRAEEAPLPACLTPVYPTTAGLSQHALRKLILAALRLPPPPELLPPELCARLGLPALHAALTLLHQPPAGTDPHTLAPENDHPAWQRLRFEELLAQQITLRRAWAARRAQRAPVLHARADDLAAQLLARLPFRLTAAQNRALAEIDADLACPHPMQRLLQGDVGSGKTILAALAMLRAASNGLQAVLMAPTEILADQHHQRLTQWLAPLGLAVERITASGRSKQRQAALQRLQTQQSLLAVGTHALLEDPVALPALALAVVDEQHRFGVRQRLALRQKTTHSVPHLLMMSATPIPRTLAMTHFADLDCTTIDELPPGRSPIRTLLATDARRAEIIARLARACASGAQAYWVCPLIEESETLQLKTAVETHARLCAELPQLAIGLVHGRLKAAEKAEIMQQFSDGTLHILVATTVIEVGVDVSRASIMVIEHAERFGLAQLHQLRGRVGRGAAQSTCILLYSPPLSATARDRLHAIHQHADGFAIAAEDLRIRGPGEFIGARQSGVPILRLADLERDEPLIAPARQLAEDLLAHAPERAQAIAQRWFGQTEALLGA